MIDLFDHIVPVSSSTTVQTQELSHPDSGRLSRSLTTLSHSPPDHSRLHQPLLPRSSTTVHRIPRKPPTNHASRKPVVSKINLLDLATEITAVIFRYAHKPKDFHYLLPSGAGPLIPRKYNLPLTVSKEWYRRVRPIYYEMLRLTWIRTPEFVDMIQREDILGDYIRSIHVKIEGKQFYKVVRAQESRMSEGTKLSDAQWCLLISQYIDSPLMTLALCLDSLVQLRDLTLRFTDCKGGEVSLQSKYSLRKEMADDSDRVDCCEFTTFSAKFISRHCHGSKTNSNKSLPNTLLSDSPQTRDKPKITLPVTSFPGSINALEQKTNIQCQDLFHPSLIPNWQPSEDILSTISLDAPSPSYPSLESFTIYREGRMDPTPRPCSEMYIISTEQVLSPPLDPT